MGIIEQWGNGLKIISDELKKYPEIEFKWTHPGMSFRVTFLQVNYKKEQEDKVKKTDSTNDYERLRTITNDYERLPIEQQRILLYLIEHKQITRKQASNIIESGSTKTYESLKELLEKDLIRVHGKGRGTYYTLM